MPRFTVHDLCIILEAHQKKLTLESKESLVTHLVLLPDDYMSLEKYLPLSEGQNSQFLSNSKIELIIWGIVSNTVHPCAHVVR